MGIAIINQRFSIGINEDLLNLESGNQTSELQQYKSKPSSLENALKLRYMPSLKLNYSSGAFSRALLHNKKVRTRYFGDETSYIPYTPCPGGQEGLDGQASYTLCQKRNISSKGPEHSRVQFWDSA